MASGTWSYTSFGFNLGSGTWEFDESTGTLTVGGTGSVGGYSPPWSTYKESVKKVVILTGITGIGGGFDGYPMTDITFPEGMTTISDICFVGCTNLKSVVIPDSVVSLGNSSSTQCLFAGCTALTSVIIGSGVSSIPSRAFEGCYNLKEIYFRGGQVKMSYYSWIGGKDYYNFNLGTSTNPVTARVYTTGWGSDEVFTTDVRGSYTTFIYETWTPPSSTGSTFNINVDGEYKQFDGFVNVKGDWKQIEAHFVNVKNNWKEGV